jgi:NAD(P)-dependent dehydrogenase (short-subunit alcohol dehydrogenase family)
MLLTDKVALLVGARRMGEPLARAMAERGADVAVSYRTSADAAEAAAAGVRAAGRRAMVLPCDVRDADAVNAMVDLVATDLGRLDVLVVMASRYDHVPFEALSVESLDAQLAVDLRGTFLCMRAAVPHLRAAGGGRMVVFSDWTAASGRPRYPGYTGYYVAKAGVKALAESFALELAADNILVNAIAPGPVLAPDTMSDDTRARVEAATPLGRWGGAGEVTKSVMALIESDFITGDTIRLDGGRHLQ